MFDVRCLLLLAVARTRVHVHTGGGAHGWFNLVGQRLHRDSPRHAEIDSSVEVERVRAFLSLRRLCRSCCVYPGVD